jgi:hypothetical protein
MKTPATLAGVFYMTERKITSALKNITSCKENGHRMEGLLRSYHLNLDLVRFILTSSAPHISLKDKKIKAVINELLAEMRTNQKLHAIINKKSIKSLKPWLTKMDIFFKKLKSGQPENLFVLQQETEKIFGILKISANKLLVKK